MRTRAPAVFVAVAVLMAACQPSTTVPSDGPQKIEYGLRPPTGSTSSEEDTLEALGVFEARLRVLGAGPLSTAVAPDAITLGVPVSSDDEQVRSVLSTTGDVRFVPLGSSDDIPAVEGQPLPEPLPALFEEDQIASARVVNDPNTGSAVLINLEDDGARQFAAYTTTHVGDWFAIELDGRVLAIPIVSGPITDGALVLSMPQQDHTVPPEILAAILSAGPIPEAWRNPRISR